MITFDDPLRDPGLDSLLDLDGEAFVVDLAGQYWVYFRVRRAPRTTDKPHGLEYSMTLHGPDGKRLVGFDNAHPVRRTAGPAGRSTAQLDHRHRHATTRPYRYKNAATLLVDFWREVEVVLKERGVTY
ncbi:MAG TPA: DUF6516 family protein [Sphingomicrobium sp.]|nr:DUF6516 family protein [Sphingomicrobium sp.]